MVGFRVKLARRLGRMYALAECGSLFCAAAKEKKRKHTLSISFAHPAYPTKTSNSYTTDARARFLSFFLCDRSCLFARGSGIGAS